MTDQQRPIIRRVLLADDDAQVTLVIKEALEDRFDCTVARVTDGSQAVARLAETPFDLFISDLLMPGLHGTELIRKAHERYPDVSIMVMTGFTRDFPYEEVIDAGASDFIAKPFVLEELTAKVKRIFNDRDERSAVVNEDSHFRNVFTCSVDPMLLMDPASLEVIRANPAYEALSGPAADGGEKPPFIERLPSLDRDRFEQAVHAGGGRGSVSDLLFSRGDGAEVFLDVSLTLVEGRDEPILFLSLKDVTQRREVEKELTAAAMSDSLTGLLNRRSFDQAIRLATRRARAEQLPLTLLLIDLDNFKRCNDTHGHTTGDTLLHSVGQAIKNSIRDQSGDAGFRCGGDEFAVLLRDTGIEAGCNIAGRIVEHFLREETYGTSLSVGVAQYQPPAPAEDFFHSADRALYQAKDRGKNTVCAL